MSFKKDLRLLAKPYYLINIFLSISYILSKRIPVICNYIFAQNDCELDGVSVQQSIFIIISAIFNYILLINPFIEGDGNSLLSYDCHHDKDKEDWQCDHDKLLDI